MPKRILAALFLFLLAIFGVHSITFAALQIGLARQVDNEQSIVDSANLNWWLTDNWALRGSYSWDTQDSGLAALYKINPRSKTAFYLGLATNDLSGKESSANQTSHPNVQLLAGMEWDLSRIKPGLSLMIEAGINPNNNTSDNNGPSSSLGLSINYRFPSIKANRNSKDTILLAKLITLEAPDEPFEGQVAVAAVVLNRTHSDDFPDSVAKVIYEPGQFATAKRLSETDPSERTLKAAKIAQDGEDPSRGALYFYNPATASQRAREYIKNAHFHVTARIGRHVFYK